MFLKCHHFASRLRSGTIFARSMREQALLDLIEHHLIERERRSRSRGGSYFKALTERHFPKKGRKSPKT
jgi:predicted transcriptional regulator